MSVRSRTTTQVILTGTGKFIIIFHFSVINSLLTYLLKRTTCDVQNIAKLYPLCECDTWSQTCCVSLIRRELAWN